MGFDDRLSLFLLGCLIGSVVGYMVRLLQETREKIDRVDANIKNTHHARDEKGFMRYRLVADMAMLFALTLTVWAALSTQQVNNDLKETQGDLKIAQGRIEHVAGCTVRTLSQAIEALNERTTYTVSQVDSNVDLQRAQTKMLQILVHKPPYSEVNRTKAVQKYFKALGRFFELSDKTKRTAIANSYPTKEEFEKCLDRGMAE